MGKSKKKARVAGNAQRNHLVATPMSGYNQNNH